VLALASHLLSTEPLLLPLSPLTAPRSPRPPGENEGNLRFALDRWRGALQLERAPIVLGGPGLTGPGLLTPEEAELVQRWDPGSEPDDTIGFFVARLRKSASTL
jgi:16S rRNA C967 or C1407 C5-methylase (RsmB/RsmF family)